MKTTPTKLIFAAVTATTICLGANAETQTIEVTPPPDVSAQFFKVKFGE